MTDTKSERDATVSDDDQYVQKMEKAARKLLDVPDEAFITFDTSATSWQYSSHTAGTDVSHTVEANWFDPTTGKYRHAQKQYEDIGSLLRDILTHSE